MSKDQNDALRKVLDQIEEGEAPNAERYMNVIGKAMDDVIALANEDGHKICRSDGAFEAQAALWAWINEWQDLPLEKQA